MTSRERVLCALRGHTPDRVPYCETGVSARLMQQIWGQADERADGGIDEMDARGPEMELAISESLNRDMVCFRVHPPVPAKREVGGDGVVFYGDGEIKTLSDVDRLGLPDPESDSVWAGAVDLIARAGDRAVCLATRVGISPVYLAMGTEDFAIALYENPVLIEALAARYTDWARRAIRKGCQLGFDYVLTADDLAYRSGPLMSPGMFRELLLPRMRPVADAIDAPRVFHSDGDMTALLPDLVDLGISGFNPVEPEAMDIVAVKREWGSKICLMGNVSVHLLAAGTPEDIRENVRSLLQKVAPGGGYILSSGNSLASYCRPENVQAMVDALKDMGAYPIVV